ncbi:MAG: NADH-quinone oxidoreductase subunit H [Bacteriovoracaceae bacterium]|nr:NADH-quinone oxidoreductase subunit H [Bacteriovoracaceae bacterium]
MDTGVLQYAVRVVVILCVVLILVPLVAYIEQRFFILKLKNLGRYRLYQFFFDHMKTMFKDNKRCKKQGYHTLLLATSLLPLAAIPLFSSFNYRGQSLVFELIDPHWSFFYILITLCLISIVELLISYLIQGKVSKGAIRAGIFNIGNDLCIILSLLALLFIYKTFNLHEIIIIQNEPLWHFFPRWGIFVQPLAGLVFLICLMVKLNLAPFNSDSAPSELIYSKYLGYSPYSFMIAVISRYLYMISLILIFVTFFMGGYNILPFFTDVIERYPHTITLFQILSVILKMFIVLLLFTWPKGLISTFKIDMVLEISLKRSLIFAIINLFTTITIVHYGY